jgi:hypothetical protein
MFSQPKIPGGDRADARCGHEQPDSATAASGGAHLRVELANTSKGGMACGDQRLEDRLSSGATSRSSAIAYSARPMRPPTRLPNMTPKVLSRPRISFSKRTGMPTSALRAVRSARTT